MLFENKEEYHLFKNVWGFYPHEVDSKTVKLYLISTEGETLNQERWKFQ
jgi:hypothetical protein